MKMMSGMTLFLEINIKERMIVRIFLARIPELLLLMTLLMMMVWNMLVLRTEY